MKIVIDIAEKDYNDITLTGENTINLGVLLALRKAVRNGTPLPKDHGRLIDADELYNFVVEKYSEGEQLAIDISDASTIIEADRGE